MSWVSILKLSKAEIVSGFPKFFVYGQNIRDT